MQSSGSSSDPFEDAFLHAYPNPERKGCPGDTVLKGLASKQLPISHPARMHITQCSPCFREFRQFEAQIRHIARVKLYGAIAATLLIIIGSFFIYRHFQQGLDTHLIAEGNRNAPQINHIPGVLNYQGISAKRGAGSPPSTQTSEQVISRSVHELSIVLPIGREAGAYVVEIFPQVDFSKPLARYTGEASIDAEGVTTLRTHVNFTTFAAGPYTVTWHVAGSEFSQSGTFVLR